MPLGQGGDRLREQAAIIDIDITIAIEVGLGTVVRLVVRLCVPAAMVLTMSRSDLAPATATAPSALASLNG